MEESVSSEVPAAVDGVHEAGGTRALIGRQSRRELIIRETDRVEPGEPDMKSVRS